MQINFNDPAVLKAINARLIKEHGETVAANYALDLMGDALVAERDALQKHNAALVERTTNDQKLIEELRAENERLSGVAERGKRKA